MFKNILFVVLSLTAILLLFTKVDNFFSDRLVSAIWPLGHISVFAFWSFLLLRYQPSIKSASLTHQFLLISAFCFSVGITIELIQPFFGRSKELGDLFLNYTGALLSLIMFSLHKTPTFFKMAYFVCAGYLLTPSVLLVYDEIKTQSDFPVLASFEHDIELTRWKADQKLSISSPVQLSQKNSMMDITFVPRQYSGVALRYFPSNWQAYKNMTIRFYNPNPESLPVTLIMTDKHYNKLKPNYKDRYQEKLKIKPGYSEKTILLSTIQKGVMLREMDLQQIAGVDFYMYDLIKPVHLFMDKLYLH